MPAPQDCQEEACAIQSCLTKNNYNESACSAYVESLYRCCQKMYAAADREGRSAEESKSTACPIRSVVERKMRRIEAEKAQ
ncbi:hypothetical protein I302_107125 [Kwoniella bestiolae CBS 10118]|uniref:Cx9C motif-containing protein 4, mitochondrial n=1 Tax=Kwoniella bestiolae CBS 10118 TaxID=1296100 RepID=A0A1B9FZG4_9TREE|nr:hypothetical protein I302_05609 [Kwoniella bestiolae CBS 10118]OCF24151.1 hypothetical protein I302_05609 [Kwoniella bestiolae CBS 10118]